MLKKTLDGIPFFEFELFQEFRSGLRHAVFTRHTNIDHATEIQKILQTDAPPLSLKNQLHGTDIVIIEKNVKRNKVAQPWLGINDLASLRLGLGDVLATATSKIPLVIRIADCASIMIFDPVKKVIANVHAGWRGLAKRAIHKTVEKFCARYGSQRQDLLACISPMIGPCCYCFSDPYRELPEDLHRYIKVAPFGRSNEVASLRLGLEEKVDLWAITEGHLRECGILASHIENPRLCTACHPEDFFSYRREGDSGRFGTAIMLC